jgi:hypothetical protein
VNRKPITCRLGLLALGVVLSGAGTTLGEEPSFSGKTVGVWVRSPIGGGALLNRVEVRTLGDRRFLVGEPVVPDGDPAPSRPTRIWFLMDDVVQLREYPGVDAARLDLGTGARPLPPPDWVVSDPRIVVPFRVEAGRQAEVQRLELFASRDGGRSWERVAQADPGAGEFVYNAPEDGRYLFAVRQILKNGEAHPPDSQPVEPQLSVSLRRADEAAPTHGADAAPTPRP